MKEGDRRRGGIAAAVPAFAALPQSEPDLAGKSILITKLEWLGESGAGPWVRAVLD